MQQIYRGTPMPKCNFNKVAKQYLNMLYSLNTSVCSIHSIHQYALLLTCPCSNGYSQIDLSSSILLQTLGLSVIWIRDRKPITAWKVSKYGFFLVHIFTHSDWSVSLRIQSKSGKIWTRKNYVFEHFSRSTFFCFLAITQWKDFIVSRCVMTPLQNIFFNLSRTFKGLTIIVPLTWVPFFRINCVKASPLYQLLM